MLNVEKTVISQYTNAASMMSVINSFNTWVDPQVDLDEFYRLIWNVETAQGIGLDIWGRIVGVGRVLQVAADKFLGFEEATNVSADPFNQSPLYGGQQLTANFALSDGAFRLLIYAKALANITDGSTAGINQILLLLFPGRGDAYVTDGLDMTMTYSFTFPLEPFEVAILQASGVLPKPAGVEASVVQL